MGRRKNEAGISAEKNGEKPALDGDRMVQGPLALREGLGAADLVSGRPSSAENCFFMTGVAEMIRHWKN